MTTTHSMSVKEKKRQHFMVCWRIRGDHWLELHTFCPNELRYDTYENVIKYVEQLVTEAKTQPVKGTFYYMSRLRKKLTYTIKVKNTRGEYDIYKP